MIGALILNAIVIVYINKRRKHKEFTRFFLTSLATVDVLVGITLMPFSIANEFMEMKQLLGVTACSAMNSLDVMLTSASIIHLSVLTFERYIALCKPFSYGRVCNRRNMIIMFIMSWILVATVSFGLIMPGFHHLGIDPFILTCIENVSRQCRFVVNIYYDLIISSVTIFIPGFFIFGFNTLVMKHVRKQSTKRKFYLTCGGQSRNHRNGSESQSLHIAKTIAVLTGSFFLFWSPFFIVTKILVFTKYNMPYIVEIAVIWLGYANSCINPLLFLLLQSKTCIGKR
jgi:hypothetical protein